MAEGKDKNDSTLVGVATSKLDVAAEVVAVGVGIGVAKNSIEDAFYKKYKEAKQEFPELADVRAWRHKARAEIINNKELDGKRAWGGLVSQRAIEFRKVEKQFAEKAHAVFDKQGFSNVLDYMVALDSTALKKTGTDVFTVAAVALGALLALANIKNLSKIFSKDDSRKSSDYSR